MYNVQWHSHDNWELVYCLSGKGCFQFEDGTSLEYRAGEAVAIPPYVRHANYSEEGFANIFLTMSEPTFPYHNAFRVCDDSEQHLSVAFSQAKYYFFTDIKRKELLLASLGDLIASYLIVYCSNNDYSEPVETIRTRIMSCYTDPNYDLEQDIRKMPFHYDYLRKLFKKEVGITPLQYMTNMRMKKAESMLAAMWTNEYSVAEIADMCGFGDALYFSRVFKKYFECSPSQYVKSCQKKSEYA